MRKTIKLALWILAIAVASVTILVEFPSAFVIEEIKNAAGPKALILYHPSRDTRFSDDLSLALAQGLHQGGVQVDRATMSPGTPDAFHSYRLIAIVSNTYYWTPDLPTLWYLRRAHLKSNALIGLIGGSGATDRAKEILAQSLRDTGSTLIGVRSFWLLRPNDKSRLSEPNRGVALDLARQFGRETAARLSHTAKAESTAGPNPAPMS